MQFDTSRVTVAIGELADAVTQIRSADCTDPAEIRDCLEAVAIAAIEVGTAAGDKIGELAQHVDRNDRDVDQLRRDLADLANDLRHLTR